MAVAGGEREARNEINRTDYVKSRGSLKCIPMCVGGAGICTRMEGVGLRLDHGLFIEGNSRNSKYVGADAGKWKDEVVGVCSFYSEA